jgi:hypothetical protein
MDAAPERPQAIDPCELHARESQRLQPDRTPDEPSTPGEGTSTAECPYVTGTVTRYCTLTPLTLTDAEREAIVTALAFLREEADEPGVAQDADTLRGLLERTR